MMNNKHLERLHSDLRTLLIAGEGEGYAAAASSAALTLGSVRKVLSSGSSEQGQAMRDGMLVRISPARPPQTNLPESILREETTPTCIMDLLVLTLRFQEFECRKDTEAVIAELLAGSEMAVQLFGEDLLLKLCQAYEWCNYGAVALNSGNILRLALRHDVVLRRVLNFPSPEPVGGHSTAMFEASLLRRFFKYVDVVDFEVASDAFWTFREIMTRNQGIAAEYLNVHFTPFFMQFNKLLQPQQNYVTRRQSLKILGGLLLTKANFSVMQRFTQSTQFLKSVMVMLKDGSSHIKYEAFHVFKLFVANPRKSDNIKLILAMNKDRLLEFFQTFGEPQTGEPVDASLQDEKALVIKEISSLQPVAKKPSGFTSSPASSAPHNIPLQQPFATGIQQSQRPRY